MTNLRGASIKEFMDTIEEMRTLYHFTDDQAKIVSTYDPPSDAHRKVEIYIKDEETGVHITMQKDIIAKEDDPWKR